MTRRVFLAMPAIAVASEVPDTPRNRVCIAANEFNAQYADWAERMNERLDVVNAKAVEAFEPLRELWRKVERNFKTWVRGY